MPKLVCVKCRVIMKVKKNGVGFLEYTETGPYKLTASDKWECPKCSFEILAGFAEEGLHSTNGNFDRLIIYHIDNNTLVREATDVNSNSK